MKAAQIHKCAKIETDPVVIDDIERPKPGRGQVLVKVDAAGVCRSNLNMVEGDWLASGVPPKFPIIPGHEMAGTVAELGPGVESIRVNERVGLQPLWTSCGECDLCLSGGEYWCPKNKILGETVDGCFAEYILGYEGHVYPLPPSIDAVSAAPLFCAGVTAYGAVKKAGIGPGMKVAVFGVGGVGHMAVQFAKLYGADVYAVARSVLHLRLAQELGAVPVDGSKDPVGELTKLGKMDVSILFAPSSEAAMQAVKSTKVRGTVVMGAPAGIEAFPFDEEKKILGSLVGGRKATMEVVALAASGKVKAVTETHSLGEANQMLKSLKNGEVKARAVLVP
jgi:alcohol dehydrogenase, propanol-preferring